jgi:flagellar hook protein FlgE
MNVASLQFQVEANNTANMNTRGFEASQVVQAEGPSGGVTAQVRPTGDPAPVFQERGEFAKLSNTNAVGATVSRTKAIAMYRANAAVLDIGANLDETLLDIIG